ncbi:prevent-host-death family protein [Dyadobacter fanqingshengii]|uniref:Prevent-host-death family protein n=1 Tax=Dyadobacter fanqingshengii TaxID=2906443 RepID=A0A9X1PC63_9BACT|nr:prevent-host-death family protein [Dyadobacter fanqingshengii]MCF0042504.1 prevent-host-death family protein [Dyadobacter fanqingshengii]MCF2506694.1 prevent-host-death family protein [Dyadobacter fanqingshengii]USJ34973.1 prevent-host-death family protein [Dyadobacter fanqingshengii]
MNLHAQIIEESGRPKFAVLPIDEYESLLKELSEFDSIEDLADYLKAVKIKSENKNWHSLDQVKAELGL